MKGKTQKGITLVALIITIVILLILAVVAISSIQENGILQYATNAATGYNESVTNEQNILGEYESFLQNGGKSSYEAYEIGDEVKIGDEGFYVIKDSNEKEEKVLLLAKECINTTTWTQETTDDATRVAFSTTKDWTAGYGENIVETGVPDENTHPAAYAAYRYAKEIDENANGRLPYWADEIDGIYESNQNILEFPSQTGWEGSRCWLASSGGDDYIMTIGSYSYGVLIGALNDSPPIYSEVGEFVRPVVEISKAKVTRVAEAQ